MSATVAGRPDDVVRLLSDAPEGLSDGDLARALGAGVRPQSINTLCRRLAASGVVERVGTRPIRNRLVAPSPDPVTSRGADGPAEADAPSESDAPSEADAPSESDAPGEADAPCEPRRDVLQAWSRTVNVQAAVAAWLRHRGGTIRSATLDGAAPARDLVARLDGDEVHVEVTGWPPDGVRTHPNTIAGDWFSAATRAAIRRRRAHPHARIVIAVPDTRRYRTLAGSRSEALAGSRAEVWFLGPSGAVDEVVADGG